MISIIIPTYNEEKSIERVLESLVDNNNLEIVVVDGYSYDRTKEVAQQFPIKVAECIKNRAQQMNVGARLARGDILLFLHADCLLERGSLEVIENCLKNGYMGGCLEQSIDLRKIIYRFIENSGNIRAKIFKVFYGDQAIFVRKDVFFKLGGFDDVILFEDVLFSKKLVRKGKTKVLNKRVFVSPRRWQKRGIIKTTFINWFLTMGFIFNVPLERLKKIYLDVR